MKVIEIKRTRPAPSPIQRIAQTCVSSSSDGRTAKNGSPCITLPCIDGADIAITDHMLSRHMAILGDSGEGKTNLLKYCVAGIKRSMRVNDALVIFDVKGDYLREFHRDGDLVIASDNMRCGHETQRWSIVREAGMDGTQRYEENAFEIARSLFEKSICTSSTPFFPRAASDLFASLIQLQLLERNLGVIHDNATLFELCMLPTDTMLERLGKFECLGGVCQYIERQDEQTAGIISELRTHVREWLVGGFRDCGDFSMRNYIRSPGGRTIFMEYDVGLGEVLSPVYSLLFDLAIKESLVGQRTGRTILVMDEFRLLPEVRHLADGVSLGREQGLCIIMATQNISQLHGIHGKTGAEGMLSLFNTLACFRSNDALTRRYVCDRLGRGYYAMKYPGSVYGGANHTLVQDTDVQDKDLLNLHTGEMLFSSGGQPWGKHRLCQFKRKEGGSRG